MKRLLACMLSLLMIIMAPAMAEGAALSDCITVFVTLDGFIPEEDETYYINFTADDASYPMPEGSVGGVYEIEIVGADSMILPDIVYESDGVYTYTLTQEAGLAENGEYDTGTVYILTVTVADGTADWTLTVEDEEVEAAEFFNLYSSTSTTATSTDWIIVLVIFALMIASTQSRQNAMTKEEKRRRKEQKEQIRRGMEMDAQIAKDAESQDALQSQDAQEEAKDD